MRARGISGGVALAIHAALLLALPGRSPVAAAPDPELAIEVAAEPAPLPPATVEARATAAPEARVRAPAVAMPPSRRLQGSVHAPGDVRGNGGAASPSATFDFRPLGTTADLGLGRAIVASGPAAGAEPAPVPSPPPPDASSALRGALRQRDLDLGLGPEGPVVAALIRAMQASRAPLDDTATFEATLAADGHVTALVVVDRTDEGWDDARARTLEALEGKTANLRGRAGAVVRVLVTSRLVEPPKSVLDKVGAILVLELGELARKQQRGVHVRLLSVREPG